jgi:hypothetical protein
MQETCMYSSSSLQKVCNLDKKAYVYEIAENTPQYHCEGNHCVHSGKTETNTTITIVVITLWLSVTKYQTIVFSMNAID